MGPIPLYNAPLLLIDDNVDDAVLAARALERSGLPAKLWVASSGREAWNLLTTQFAKDPPKALFLDLNMPEWSGFELLQRIRADETTRLLPVVILTTSRERADIEKSYRLGANSFVTKPVDFVEFSSLFARMTSYWLTANEVAR